MLFRSHCSQHILPCHMTSASDKQIPALAQTPAAQQFPPSLIDCHPPPLLFPSPASLLPRTITITSTPQIGRASCRERVCQYVWKWGGGGGGEGGGRRGGMNTMKGETDVVHPCGGHHSRDSRFVSPEIVLTPYQTPLK